MPYAITTADVQPGVASYRLGGTEEWQLQAATFAFDASGIASAVEVYLDAASSIGGRIYRQALAQTDSSFFASLAPGAEPWSNTGSQSDYWPQTAPENNNESVTMRLAPITLTPGCTLYVYCAKASQAWPTDPFSNIDTGGVFSDVLLWVEDTGQLGRNLPDVANPLLLGVGSG